MQIAVCLKHVVTRDGAVRVDDSGVWIRDRDAGFELNEPDAYALEEALRLSVCRRNRVMNLAHPRHQCRRFRLGRGVLVLAENCHRNEEREN